MMTDDEYKEYLVALARRHLKSGWIEIPAGGGTKVWYSRGENISNEIARLSAAARLVRVVADRPDSVNLLKELTQEIKNINVGYIFELMEVSGVLSALDEAPEITFPNLRRAVIPEEDVYLLQHAGIADAEAEITLFIHYARTHVGHKDSAPSSIARQAETELQHAGVRIEQLASQPPPALNQPGLNQAALKKRKLFNGIGKILAGTVTAAGNLLLAAGTLIAPNPATAYGVIGSSALAIGGVFQGIGDLRGE
jgi:hypothetical protein